jgi:hypothetical protein
MITWHSFHTCKCPLFSIINTHPWRMDGFRVEGTLITAWKWVIGSKRYLCVFLKFYFSFKKKKVFVVLFFFVALLFFFFQLDVFFFFIVQRIKCEILVKWVLQFKNYHYLFVIFILFYYGRFLLFHHVRECGNGTRGGSKGRVLKFTRNELYIQDLAKWLESKSVEMRRMHEQMLLARSIEWKVKRMRKR